jgi:RNA polymerase sigma factor (sigma-70 family)
MAGGVQVDNLDSMHLTASAQVTPALAARLHGESGAVRWTLPLVAFQAALDASLAHAFADRTPSAAEIEQYVKSLHLDDLALAAACAAGHDAAWNHFVLEFRPALYRAADALDPSGGARDLADGLYADLFGLQTSEGARRSLFRYFHGRSRLTTWLRAVLSPRHIDRIRATRRLEALPDDESASPVAAPASAPDPERPKRLAVMQDALATAIASLAARDRLRLTCYYVQRLTLAEIGRALGEHEATVSRHLTRTRGLIRDATERHLRERHGLSPAAIAECIQSVVADAGPLDLEALVGTSFRIRKKDGPGRSE